MKKLLFFLFFGVLCAVGCTDKDETMAGGTEEGLNWNLSKEGILTISGKGAMPDYLEESHTAPWHKYRNYITGVTIGDDVSSIGREAFLDCGKMTSITIGKSVTAIGMSAFDRCSSLTEIINYGETPQAIFESRFRGVIWGTFGNLQKGKCTLLVPTGSVEAYRNANVWNGFYTVGVIGDPGSIEELGNIGPLRWTLDDNGVLFIRGIGDIPDYNAIREWYSPWAYNKSIVRVIIDEGVNRIGSQAFDGCINLYSITIPNSVTTMGSAIFYGCSGLTEIINYRATPPTVDAYLLAWGVNEPGCTIFVPAGSEAAYRAAEEWRDFVNIEAINSAQ